MRKEDTRARQGCLAIFSLADPGTRTATGLAAGFGLSGRAAVWWHVACVLPGGGVGSFLTASVGARSLLRVVVARSVLRWPLALLGGCAPCNSRWLVRVLACDPVMCGVL